MKIGDLLNTLAAKLGLQNDPNFQTLIANAALADIDVDDTLAGQFDTGLLSLQAAKNNTEIQNAYKPILLKKLDEQFAHLATKYGFEAENTAERSTYERANILERVLDAKIAELEKKDGNGNDEKKLQAEIARLQAELQSAASSKDQEIANLKADFAKQVLASLVNAELKGKSYANTDLGDTNIVVANTLLNQALANDKISLVNDNGVIRLKQAENTSLDYYDPSHKQVAFSEYVDKLLAEKKLLAVSTNTPPETPVVVNRPDDKKVDTSRVDAAVAASMADLS